MYPYIITEQKITVVIDGRIFSVYKDDDSDLFEKVKAAIYANDKETVLVLSNPAKTVEEAVKETTDITYEHGFVWYRGIQVNNYVVDKILALKKAGADVKRLENLLVRLYRNPNKEVIPFLYQFLEYGGNPITENGTFLAFKRVRSNYRDIHSGKFDNSPGAVVTEDRGVVNSNRDTTCARGLHFCSWEYLQSFGSCDSANDRVVIVEVDPEDVVMIPRDYNNTKARCCKYKVLYDFGKSWGEIRDVNVLKQELNKAAVNINPVVETPKPVKESCSTVASLSCNTVASLAKSSRIVNAIKMVVSDQLGINVSNSDLATPVEDLGADSLDLVELVMGIEDELEIEIPDEVAERMGTQASILTIYDFVMLNYFDDVARLLTPAEASYIEANRVKKAVSKAAVKTAPVAKALPQRGPDGRFLSKAQVAAQTAKQATVQLGIVRSLGANSQYWNGAEWKPHYAGVRMRNATGQFIAGQLLHPDGFFYIK